MVAVEHRFYGVSMPTPDLSTESLIYLSSRQAIADIAAVQEYIARQYNARRHKFIVIGGSYAGSLAAWTRLTYPSLFDIAIASSAPVLAVESNPNYCLHVSRFMVLI